MKAVEPGLVILLLLACAFAYSAMQLDVKQAEQVPIISNADYVEFDYQTVFNVPDFNPLDEGDCLGGSSLRSRSPIF